MTRQLGFSDSVYGLGAGIFFMGYFLFEIPSNLIMQRVGATAWIARIMIVWGLLSAATLLVTTPMQFYVVRFLLGLGEAGFAPGILLYLTHWYPAKRRAKATATFLTGLAWAGIIGGPLSGLIMRVSTGWPVWPAGSGYFCWKPYRLSCWALWLWSGWTTPPARHAG